MQKIKKKQNKNNSNKTVKEKKTESKMYWKPTRHMLQITVAMFSFDNLLPLSFHLLSGHQEQQTLNSEQLNKYSWAKSISNFFQREYWNDKNIRSSHQRCSIKEDFIRNFTKFAGKHMSQSLFFNQVAGRQLY